jgi:hypothetical protein
LFLCLQVKLNPHREPDRFPAPNAVYGCHLKNTGDCEILFNAAEQALNEAALDGQTKMAALGLRYASHRQDVPCLRLKRMKIRLPP